MMSISEQLAITCGIKPIEVKGHTIYPNFKDPENFMKLYEMKIFAGNCAYPTIADMLITKRYDCSTVANFLKSLNSLLLDDDTIYSIEVKRKIARSKWK